MAYDGTVKIGTDLDGSGAEKGLKNLGKVIASSAIVTAIGSIGKAIVSSYADYEQLVGGVDTLFKESSKALQDYAANAYKTAGLSANAYMETVTSFSASLIQSLGGDTKSAVTYADQAVTDMADNANKFGTAMESIQFAYQGFAKQNFTVLDNLKLGYGGTKTEMERLLVDAEKLSGLQFDISSFADITQAIHVIQDSMGVAGATAAEAEHTISGSINALKGAWANLLTGLADSNADVAKLAGDVVKQFKTVAKNVLPVIGQIADSIPGFKQLKAMLPIIVSVGAAFAAWKVIDTVTKGIEKYTSWLDNGVEILQKFREGQVGANVATAALNGQLSISAIVAAVQEGAMTKAAAATAIYNKAAAAMGGPINLAIIAVTALVAGLIAFDAATNTALKEAKAMNEEIKETADAAREATAAFQDTVTGIDTNAKVGRDLVNELAQIGPVSKDNADQMARQANIVEQLNRVYPELGLEVDQLTGELNKSIPTIEQYVENFQRIAESEAAYDEIVRLKQEAIGLKSSLDAASKAKSDYEAEVERTGGRLTRNATYRELALNVDLATEAFNANAAAQANVTDMMADYQAEAIKTAEVTGATSQEVLDMAAKYGVADAEIQAFVDNGGSLEEWAARQDAAITSAEESLNRLVEAYYNMNEQIKASDEQSLADRNANIEANQAAVNAYASNLDAIAAQAGEKGIEINSRLWSELQSGTPESMDLANDILASMELNDGQWEQLNSNFSGGLEGALGSVSQNMKFADGANPAQAILDEMVITLAEDSTVETASEGVVEDALSAAKSRVAGLDFSQIGTNMMKGIENGIRNGTAGIVAAINSAIADAHAAAQKIDQQASPSKWWEKFGLNDMKGFAMGIDSGANLVQQAQADMVRNLQRQMAPVYAAEGVNPGYGSVVNNYTQNLYTHDSLSPHEQMQEFEAFKAREGWLLP